MQGTLCKWTNYMSGWQQRWVVLDGSTLAYYLAATEVHQGCRGSFKVTSCDIHVHPTDHLRFDIVMPGGRQVLYLKASSTVERQQWVVALGTSKQEEEGNIGKLLGPSLDQQVAVRSKMAELQANCQLLFSQVSNMRSAAFSPSPDTESMQEVATLISHTCDKFLKILSECMLLSTASVRGVGTVPATPTDHSSPTSSFAPMKPLARVPHLLSDKPSPSPHPLILSFPISLPPFTTRLGNEEASPKSTDEQTHSLPVHLVATPHQVYCHLRVWMVGRGYRRAREKMRSLLFLLPDPTLVQTLRPSQLPHPRPPTLPLPPLLLTHLTATPPNPHRAHIFSRHHHSHQWNSLPHVVQ
ncbi:Pleckstrin homology domain-containing family A member 8 [Geodia barretti]|nr:Pleckstrin homology domain-containing family A member 8 [Geodia barretti]